MADRFGSAQTRGKYGVASMALQRGDRRILYVSVDYIPLRHPKRRRTYKKCLAEHIASAGPVDEVHIECPGHPIARRRRRRRVA